MNADSQNHLSDQKKVGLTILVIATRKYVLFAQNLIASIEANVGLNCNCQILIFTDQPDQFTSMDLR